MLVVSGVAGVGVAYASPVSARLSAAFGHVATREGCEGGRAVVLLWSYMFLMLIFGALGVIYLHFFPGDPSSYLTRSWVWPSESIWM